MTNPELRKKIKWLTPTLIIIFMLLLGGLYLIFHFIIGSFQAPQFEKAKSEWQAVFLSNNQVYFGKIVKITDKEIVLRDIYYLQSAQLLQGPKETHIVSAQAPFLVKLGSELHGPYDEMRINRGQVLFIEDLKSDSPVMEAIKQYKP